MRIFAPRWMRTYTPFWNILLNQLHISLNKCGQSTLRAILKLKSIRSKLDFWICKNSRYCQLNNYVHILKCLIKIRKCKLTLFFGTEWRFFFSHGLNTQLLHLIQNWHLAVMIAEKFLNIKSAPAYFYPPLTLYIDQIVTPLEI